MKKFLRILLKIFGAILLIGLISFAILYAIYNEPQPKGTLNERADALAHKMLTAINHEQYQKTRFLEWSYVGGKHLYKWDKENGKAEVIWGSNKVKLNLNNPTKSLAYKNNIEVVGDNREKLVETALSYFNNDSFWLVAPFKVFDEGTKRSIASSEDGSEGLLVEYTSGGTTPGDVYLWKLLPNGFPESYQMWVKILPIGGLKATWDDWKIMENGLALPTSHRLGLMTLDMGKVRAYN